MLSNVIFAAFVKTPNEALANGRFEAAIPKD
jgi:hypothetical protein